MTEHWGHWFFCEFTPPESPIPWDISIEDADLIHHLKTVMRARPGDKLVLVRPCEAPYGATLVGIEKRQMVVRVEAILPTPPTPVVETVACIALIKGPRWELALQKLTELGVSEILPLQCHHSVIQSEGKHELKQGRWELILRQASEQSERVCIPKLHPPMTPVQLVQSGLQADLKLVASERTTASLSAILADHRSARRILYAVGPEGGWSPEEIAIWTSADFNPVSLGGTILRSETAALYMESVLHYAFSENRT